MSNQDLQDSIQNLNNQVAALIAALANPAAPAVAPPTFALSTGTAKPDQIIDYTMQTGTALCEEGCKAMYNEEKDKFDLRNDQVMSIINDISAQVRKMGWDHPVQGIVTYQVNGNNIDLIQGYGHIALDEIRSQSEPYYLHYGANADKRAAQNNAMMMQMLMDSLTVPAKNKLLVYKNEYKVSDGGTPPKQVTVATLLYKVIMRMMTLNTRSTSKALRDIIKDLPAYTVTVQGDIDLIHTRFNDAYTQLRAQGEDINT